MEMARRVYEGWLDNLPPQESTTIRVFLSSTFTDMQAERNELMKHEVPKLRKYCQERGLDFQIADMRWGVRDDAAIDHTTTDLCLKEIDNCRQTSRGPYFVAFLGDKYGHRPLPNIIDGQEFKLFRRVAMKLGHDVNVLDLWYQRDDNAEPSVFTLQPITAVLPHYNDDNPANSKLKEKHRNDWSKVSEKLRKLLQDSAMDACENQHISKESKHKYYQSVTESEVAVGILNAPQTKHRVLCYCRTLVEADLTDENAWRYMDLEDGKPNQDVEELRERLKLVKIPAVLGPDQLRKFNVYWCPKGVDPTAPDHQAYLSELCHHFTDRLMNMIDRSLLSTRTRTGQKELYQEVLHHLQFCSIKCDTFCGREELLKEINHRLSTFHGEELNDKTDHINIKSQNAKKLNIRDGGQDNSSDGDAASESDSDSDVGLVSEVDGDRDKKNRQLAREAEETRQFCAQNGVDYYMGDEIGDAESDPNRNLRLELISVPKIGTYKRPVIITGESGSGKTAVMARVAEVSKQWFPNSNCLLRFLGTSPQSTYIREVLLGLCIQIWQLYSVPNPSGFDLEVNFQYLVQYFNALLWKIDTSSAPLVIVLDSVDQLHPADHAYTLNWLPLKVPPNVHFLVSMLPNVHGCLDNTKQILPYQDLYIDVPQLPGNTAADIINRLCWKSGRRLTKIQKRFLMDKFKQCSQPLYLKLLVDEALKWHSYTAVSQIDVGLTVRTAINKLFDNLEKQHGQILIQKALGYLSAAKEGLAEVEIEDLLSLDDEVLQDVYLYHLPPDPEVIRLPPLIWKRVENDIAEYVVRRQSGGKQVINWYHRQFAEVANERYMPPRQRVDFHCQLAHYFQGTWCDKVKPLELFKVKKGTFPNASRQAPAQPLCFSPGMYNIRKLSELPYQLVQSCQYREFLAETVINIEWLYAKCKMLSLTELMTDLKMAVGEMDAMGVVDMEEVYQTIKMVQDILVLGSDNIRKDPVNVPLQLISQLGQEYDGRLPGLHTLVSQSVEWCEQTSIPLLLPMSACIPAPGGLLQTTIAADVWIIGSDRKPGQCMYLHEDRNQLFVIGMESGQPDQLRVFDLTDDGSCIMSEHLHKYIHSVQFVASNRFLHFREYVTLSKHSPNLRDRLFESSTASPVIFPNQADIITVSQTGKHIVYASVSQVYICQLGESGIKSLQVQHTLNITGKVAHLIISPDEKYLVTTAKSREVWDMATGVKLFTVGTESLDNFSIPDFTEITMVTRDNRLLCGGLNYNTHSEVSVVDLEAQSILFTLKDSIDDSAGYSLDIFSLHKSEKYLLTATKQSVVINGKTIKSPHLWNVATGQLVLICQEKVTNGPYYAAMMFGDDQLFLALASQGENNISILYAGTTLKPLTEAVLVRKLVGHSQSITQLCIKGDNSVLLSASLDSTVKLWDIAEVVETFTKTYNELEQKYIAGRGDQPSQVYTAPTDEIAKTQCLCIKKNTNLVFMGTEDGKLVVHNLKTDSQEFTAYIYQTAVTHLLMSTNGNSLIVTAKNNKLMTVWDTTKYRTIHQLQFNGANVSCLAEANDILVVGEAGMQAKGCIWNLKTGKVVREFQLLYSLYHVALNSLGTKLVSTFFDFPLVMDIEDEMGGNPDMGMVDTMMCSPTCLLISPNDQFAMTGSTDGTVRVVNMEGRYLCRMRQKSSVLCGTWSPDSRNLLTCGYRTIYVWFITNGSAKYKLSRHLDFITDIKFDSAGKFLVTCSHDKQIVLWDFRRSISVAAFITHCQLSTVDMTIDGDHIVFVPENVGSITVLKPNKILGEILTGNYNLQLNAVVKNAQALALSFSSQKIRQHTAGSASCAIL